MNRSEDTCLHQTDAQGLKPAHGPFLAVSTVAPSPVADWLVTDVLGWHCWAMRRVASSRGTGSAVEKARY
jgi:hypothetical protein